jgi:hypothetical protein
MGVVLAVSWTGGVLANACGSSHSASPDAAAPQSDAGDDADYDASFDGGLALVYEGGDLEDAYEDAPEEAAYTPPDAVPVDATPADAHTPDASDAAHPADASHPPDASPRG